jgi:hypothetical protein
VPKDVNSSVVIQLANASDICERLIVEIAIDLLEDFDS